MTAFRFRRLTTALALVTLGLGSMVGHAQAQTFGGGLQLAPTGITMGPQTRGAEVYVRNMGTETVTYRIEIGASVSNGNGQTQFSTDPGTLLGNSAAPMIVVSPRQVTVGPGEVQTVRVALRRPSDLAAGTYTARLRAQALPSESALRAGQVIPASGVALGLSVIYGASIPIRVSHE